MTFRVWAKPYDSGELANTNIFQPVKSNTDMILVGVRTWIVVYNAPNFTSLNLKIYSDSLVGGEHTPGELLATSTNVLTKSEIITENNGVREIYFDFNSFPVNGQDYYNFVLNGTDYVPTSSSHLAWRKAFPDTVYETDYTPLMVTINKAPFELYFIAGVF
jgi:hypothetical protein